MSDNLPNDRSPGYAPFQLAEKGMTRFPPNIEQISVRVDGYGGKRLIARRNDVELSFNLEPSDVEHLIKLLKQDAFIEVR